MKDNLYNIIVSDIEKRIFIQALTSLKNKQIKENKQYDFIDDLIIRTCDAPLVRGKIKRSHEER